MTEPASTAASTRGFVTMAVALAVVFAVTWSLQFVSPRSASVWWARQAQAASLVWHQDWRVFTKVPTGSDVLVYDARTLTPITSYATSGTNRWGLSRIAYTQWMETAALDQDVPAEQWHDCSAESIEQCRPALASIPVFTVANPTRDATLCGRIVFSRETPISWRDAEPAAGRTRRIDSVSLLDVTCVR
ncbi:SdpA family antimicrobial peptide system protein [Lentzea sp. NPDC059081]|uniref:SdpA family antimicrobial peptide system protein n=1 Tax=Lentzea sp. NPDC059081 TaxID=3346719 RepID=UPI003692E7A4